MNFIVGEERRDEATAMVLDRVGRISSATTLARVVVNILPFISALSSVQDNAARCRACCSAISILTRLDLAPHKDLIEKTSQALRTSWDAMDDGDEKVDMGFQIAVLLSDTQRGKALEYIRLSEEIRESLSLETMA